MLILLKTTLLNLRKEPTYGQDLAEYAVFIGLIALVVVISITLIGGGISEVFTALATAIQNGF